MQRCSHCNHTIQFDASRRREAGVPFDRDNMSRFHPSLDMQPQVMVVISQCRSYPRSTGTREIGAAPVVFLFLRICPLPCCSLVRSAAVSRFGVFLDVRAQPKRPTSNLGPKWFIRLVTKPVPGTRKTAYHLYDSQASAWHLLHRFRENTTKLAQNIVAHPKWSLPRYATLGRS